MRSRRRNVIWRGVVLAVPCVKREIAFKFHQADYPDAGNVRCQSPPSIFLNTRTQRSCSASSIASDVSIGVSATSGSFAHADSSYGLDGRLRLGESEFEADIRVHVALRDVMNHLADGPAAVAIRRDRADSGVNPATDARNCAGRGGNLADPLLRCCSVISCGNENLPIG